MQQTLGRERRVSIRKIKQPFPPTARPPCTTWYYLQARERPRGSLGLAGRPQARREALLAKAAKTDSNVWDCPLPLSRSEAKPGRGCACLRHGVDFQH